MTLSNYCNVNGTLVLLPFLIQILLALMRPRRWVRCKEKYVAFDTEYSTKMYGFKIGYRL